MQIFSLMCQSVNLVWNIVVQYVGIICLLYKKQRKVGFLTEKGFKSVLQERRFTKC